MTSSETLLIAVIGSRCLGLTCLHHEGFTAALGAGPWLNLLESLELELGPALRHSNLCSDSPISMHLRISHANLRGAFAATALVLLLHTVLLLQNHGRVLTEFVAHDAADRCLWAQSTAIGEAALGQGTLLVTLLLWLHFNVVAGALSSVSLLKQRR